MAYYPDWAGDSFPPEDVDCSRFDWIDFAFALPTKAFDLTWDDPNVAPGLLTRLVEVAHSCNKKVKLSIGGWTGSQHFSTAVATPSSRKTFVANILKVYHFFEVDGIDIDWEYPGVQGVGDNDVNENDAANFLSFLQLLRSQLPPLAVITAATTTTPFAGEDGQPLKDVTPFAKVLDWITLMNYDAWGSSSTPGPNAPLNDGCKNSTQPDANAVAGYNAWSKAGMPAKQQVLGVPAYGYVSKSNATQLRTRQNPLRLKAEGDQIQFRDLVKQGALVASSNSNKYGPNFDGACGFTREWDCCSSTPFLRSPSEHQVVTFDDVQSIGMKAEWAKRVGMLGVNMFDASGDTGHLVDAIRRGLGLTS
ncbi:glycoside hydrolase [Roridomyces roridus]|uniref:Glycoside hydrolase n=1 Tax=Roridomyces roridus TaxID=1738132 RepID=A0AAD7C4Z2_9AGAR|nr:glycoside hydrolase [Roridomyces roridus]